MTTAYTSGVREGTVTELRTFAMLCARAFGYMFHMHDEQLAPKLRHAEVDKYYVEDLAQATLNLNTLLQVTPEEAVSLEQAERNKVDEHYAQIWESDRIARERYQAMLAQVEKWTPPSNEYKSLQEFMVSQLQDSMMFDCHEESQREPMVPRDPAVWLSDQISRAEEEVVRATKKLADHEASIRETNAWIDGLNAAFPERQ